MRPVFDANNKKEEKTFLYGIKNAIFLKNELKLIELVRCIVK